MNIPSLPKDKSIYRIEELGGRYDPESRMSVYDQLLACQSVFESTPVTPDDWDERIVHRLRESGEGNGSVDGNDNGSYKRKANTSLSQSKNDAITKLKLCTYRTNPAVISSLLEEIFLEYPSYSGYWFSVAQRWPPRRIYQVINYLIKLENPGHVTIRNPAAYFTFLIKKRKIRKKNDIL